MLQLTTLTVAAEVLCNTSHEQNMSTHAHSQCTGCDKGSLTLTTVSGLWTTSISPAHTNRQGRYRGGFRRHLVKHTQHFNYAHSTCIQTLSVQVCDVGVWLKILLILITVKVPVPNEQCEHEWFLKTSFSKLQDSAKLV